MENDKSISINNQNQTDLKEESIEPETIEAQKWLESEEGIIKKERASIEDLDIPDITFEQLAGSLNLNDFTNLKTLNCPALKLTTLDLSNCERLEKIWCQDNELTNLILPKHCSNLTLLDCSYNKLTTLDFLKNLNTEKLKELYISNNNFSNSDLTVFAVFTNLELLNIDNNYFWGSLELLKNLSKLEELHISDTEVDSGIESLPDSIRYFFCSIDERPNAKVKAIEEVWEYFKHDLKKCKKFVNNSTYKWLEENYPEDGECRRETKDEGWDESYGWNNQGEKRVDITKLDISKQELQGGLWLKRFTKLEELNCSNNQLTHLDVGDCKNLKVLKCDNNQLKNLNFLTPLTKLKELDLSDCPNLKGSLKTFKDMGDLEWLDISNTDIKEGLEYLPESIKNFYCELDYQYGSVEIAKELSKFSERIDEKSGHTKYNLDKWRTDQANNKTASSLPLERIFVIRSNLQQFLKKWGSEDKDGLTELSKLKSPEQFERFKYLTGIDHASTATTVVGGALTLLDFSTTGGVITLVAPLVGTGASQLKTSLYDAKQGKWEEFKVDADGFLDNYNSLRGILKQVEVGEWGQVNITLKELKEKTDQFLKKYDHDGNQEIDIEELTSKREKFSNELDKVKEIVKAIQGLEDKVVEYQQDKLTGIDYEKVEIKKEERDASANDENPFQKTIKNLGNKIKLNVARMDSEGEKIIELKEDVEDASIVGEISKDENLKNRIETEFTQREIIFLLKGERENQVFVISKTKDKIFNEILPRQMNRNYVLDSVKIRENGVEIESSLFFPKRFNSPKEAIKKYLEITNFVLDKDQQEQISKKVQLSIEEEKDKAAKKETPEKRHERLIKVLEEILLEKEREKLQENFFTKLEKTITECYTKKICFPCYLYEQWKDKERSESSTNLINDKGKQKETNEKHEAQIEVITDNKSH